MNEDEVYIKLEHQYMVIGNRFFILHEIPFCIGNNIREGCKVYKFDNSSDPS